MKHILITIAALVLVGCATTQQSAPPAEAKPVEPIAIHPDKPIGIHPDDVQFQFEGVPYKVISMLDVSSGNIKAVKQAIAAGADVNVKGVVGSTPLHYAALNGHKEIVELLLANGAEVNAMNDDGDTPLDWAIAYKHTETANLLRKHGGKTGEELKAEAK